ncbi:MAG: hypothetical protein ACLQIB_05895 [Isosphaeraceae bacterium]
MKTKLRCWTVGHRDRSWDAPRRVDRPFRGARGRPESADLAGAVQASTGDLLAKVAPRALVVISAKRGAYQLSVG